MVARSRSALCDVRHTAVRAEKGLVSRDDARTEASTEWVRRPAEISRQALHQSHYVAPGPASLPPERLPVAELHGQGRIGAPRTLPVASSVAGRVRAPRTAPEAMPAGAGRGVRRGSSA